MKHTFCLGTLGLGLLVSCSERAPVEPVATHEVTRGDLQIIVRAKGEVQAAQSTRVASRVAGRRALLYLVPEGTIVEEGDVLAELDVSDLEDKRATQAIAVAAARSAHEQAKKNLEVMEHSLAASERAAEGELELASVRLESFLPRSATADESPTGTGSDVVDKLRELLEAEWARSDTGERRYEDLESALVDLLGGAERSRSSTGEVTNRVLRQITEVELSSARLERAKERLRQSRQLRQQGNISDHELRTSETRYDAQLSGTNLAWNNLQLLIRFTLKEEITRMQQDVRNAELKLASVTASNESTRVGLQADLRSQETQLALATERLENFDQQIENAIMRAPSAGLVVYAREGSGSARSPVQKGMDVRERQTLINLPNTVNMIVELKIPEADIERVALDQQARIRVDSYPDQAFTGRVSHVAALPDTVSRFTNNNPRVYKTTVSVDGENPGAALRPGMSATVEILAQHLQDVVYVPLPAVQRIDGMSYVWKVTPEGPEAVDVQIGANDRTHVEITDGLSEGEQVYLGTPQRAVRG